MFYAAAAFRCGTYPILRFGALQKKFKNQKVLPNLFWDDDLRIKESERELLL